MHFIDRRNYLPGLERTAETEALTVHGTSLARFPHLGNNPPSSWWESWGKKRGRRTFKNLQGLKTCCLPGSTQSFKVRVLVRSSLNLKDLDEG